MIVYHSSNTIVESPDIQHSRKYLDFGRGFYLTSIFDQAVRYAQRFKRRGQQAWLNTYELSDSLGEWTRAQKNTMIAFSTAFVLWVAPSVLGIMYDVDSDVMKFYDSHFPEAIAAMIGGLMLFFLPVNVKTGEMTMTWKDGIEGIEWGTLLLFGGGLAMGSMMYDTGLSAWIGNGLKEALGNNPSEWLFVGVFSVAALIMSELTSHTASTNLMAPIAIGAALSLGFSPIPVAIGIALASSLGFMMPVSTPPNAIVYASGYVPITKMIKSGFIIDLIGIFLVTIPVLMLLVKYVMGVD